MASVVALVVCQFLACLFFKSQTFIASTDLLSLVISAKASIISAWVSIGDWYQYQPALFSIQYIPESSLLAEVSFKLSMIFLAVVLSPNRFNTNAANPLL